MPDNRNNGWNWIRLAKRLAIYSRDDFSCAWCGDCYPTGYGLTLDHLAGPGNIPANLVTACNSCNARRRTLGVEDFIDRLDAAGADPDEIRARVMRILRPLDMDEGRRLARERKQERYAVSDDRERALRAAIA